MYLRQCAAEQRLCIASCQDPPLRRKTATGALWLGLHAPAHRRARRLRTIRHDVSVLNDNSWPGGEERAK